jgi:hypothetical protein
MNRFGLVLGILIYASLALAQESAGEYELSPTPIGYASVQLAFDALSADPDASKSEYEGWTLFKQKADGMYILWSFTHPDHPVHPSAVRREIVKKDDEVFISMAVLCHSSRFDCDQLIEQFQQINARIKQKYAANPG